MSPNDGAAVLGSLIGLFLVAVLFWVVPITVGIKQARKKNRSPHWMWFGIHPVGGYIMMIVLLSLGPLKLCRTCGQKSKDFARVCAYCQTSFTQNS